MKRRAVAFTSAVRARSVCRSSRTVRHSEATNPTRMASGCLRMLLTGHGVERRGIVLDSPAPLGLELVLESELHLARNIVSLLRDHPEVRRTEVAARRQEVRLVRDVVHLDAKLDAARSPDLQRLAQIQVRPLYGRPMHRARGGVARRELRLQLKC